MIKYSVIMPIYNAINFIEKNLKMFEKINRDDVELIIVNDGSTDESMEIVNIYQNKIKNLKIINQENSGVSYSRNVGIKNSIGTYIFFLDCDDSIEYNLFDEIDKIYAENYDLIRYGFNNITLKHVKKNKMAKQKEIYNQSKKCKEILKLIYTTNKFNTVWNQAIKREILLKNEIYFDTNHKYAEDFELNRKLLNYVNTICFLPECLYNYYIHGNSISRTENKENVIKCIEDTIEIHTQTYIDCKKNCEEYMEETFKDISKEFKTSIKRLFFIKKLRLKELINIFYKIREFNQIKMLEEEKNTYKWKSNPFIDKCVFKNANYIEILFYKYYFKFKKMIKSMLQ